MVLGVVFLWHHVEINDVGDTRIDHVGQGGIVPVLEIQALAAGLCFKVCTWQQHTLQHTVDHRDGEAVESLFRGGIEHLAVDKLALDQFYGILGSIGRIDHAGFQRQISLKVIKINGLLEEHQFCCGSHCGCHYGIKEIRIVGHTITVAVCVAHNHLIVVHIAVALHRLRDDVHCDVRGQGFIAVRPAVAFKHLHEVVDHQTGAAVIDLF